MVASPLISTATLAERLADPDWLVADCRFDLGDPKAGVAAWREGRIPGALHVDLERDLSVAVTPHTGRHPLPSPEAFATTLSRLGIGNRSQVVCYDAGNGAYASRLWWMLRYVGHDAVLVLDGGFAAWVAEGARFRRKSRRGRSRSSSHGRGPGCSATPRASAAR